MNQDKEEICATCNFRIFGSGCPIAGKRVTDHETCNHWEKIKNNSIHDNDARIQYFKAGKILELEESA